MRLARLPVCAALLLASGCSSISGPAVVTDRPTMKAVCNVQNISGQRLLESDLGVTAIPTKSQIEVYGTSEAELRRELQRAGVATREKPCSDISVIRLGQ